MPNKAEFRILNRTADHDREAEKTVVVFGAPRGGTSMTAGVVRLLGVDLGDGLGMVSEDKAFRANFERPFTPAAWWRNFARFRTMRRRVAQRNAETGVWGWKAPSAVLYLPFLARHLRNPRYVVVVRNPLTAAFSAERRAGRSWLRSLGTSLLLYVLARRFIRRTRRPVFLFAYEWALAQPRDFVTALNDFLGTAAADARLDEAMALIDPAGGYRMVVTGAVDGRLMGMRPDVIRGWAVDRDQPGVPARLVVRVNDVIVGETTADLHRPQMNAAGAPAGRDCGFEFRLPPERSLVENDSVSITLARNGENLPNSPRPFEAEPQPG